MGEAVGFTLEQAAELLLSILNVAGLASGNRWDQWPNRAKRPRHYPKFKPSSADTPTPSSNLALMLR